MGNGITLDIENFGSTTLHSSNSNFHLNNVLHCSKLIVDLLSIQCFYVDNSCFFILTFSLYFIIDLQTKTILLEEKSENGMYQELGKKSHSSNKSFIVLLGT
jgi:hypothetical protein